MKAKTLDSHSKLHKFQIKFASMIPEKGSKIEKCIKAHTYPEESC